MQVVLRKTHRRGYAVDVLRQLHEDLTMNPAPGYDDLLPHDLVHLLVEIHWGLRDGIFGQVAAGGNAGTFRLSDERPKSESTRQRTRRARRVARPVGGGNDIARSERLASVVHARWNERAHGAALPEWYARALETSGATETEVTTTLEEAEAWSTRWRRTPIGGRTVVDWPWPEGPAPHPRADKRDAGGVTVRT
jgi:hypothetical protein